MDNYENKIYEVEELWENVIQAASTGTFDYDTFANLAKETFECLFAYARTDNVPKSLLSLILNINQFAKMPSEEKNDEYAAAQIVASEFCNQIINGWVCDENGISDEIFIVADKYGNEHFIETSTFDMSELISSCSSEEETIDISEFGDELYIDDEIDEL